MNKVIKALSVSSAILLARLLPFNIIIGSSFAMFSWSSIFAPVIAAQCGFAWVLGFLLCKKLWIAPSLLILLHRLPLFFAARAFQVRSFFISVCVPIIAMILFVIHPVGSQAWPYALYWFIPAFLYYVKNSVWSKALQASFVAHAVGSVIWLYFGSIPSETWMLLIPIVACERLLMAGGIVACDTFCKIVLRAFISIYHRSVFCRRIN